MHVDSNESMDNEINFFSLMLHSTEPSIIMDKEHIFSLLSQFAFKEDEWILPLHHHLLQYIRQVFAILENHEKELSNENWWELFIAELGLARIPFSVADGIPVMGFLETRILDFEHVYIAPLNEGSLPSVAASKSLIPYSLRKAYHLPCMEEQDAVTAYHFYRLLQRAKHIRFYYTTNLSDQGAGEKSRYLYQLQHELLEKCPPKSVIYEQQESVVNPSVVEPIVIQKSEAILMKLKENISVEFGDAEKFVGLSASALNSYIACSLRFYFDQLASIRSDDEVEGLTAGNFGNVLHKAMELAYADQEIISRDYIASLLKQVDGIVDQAVQLAYGKPAHTGHDFLMKKVLVALVTKIFEFDLESSPIQLKGLEQKLKWALPVPGHGDVWLKGIIDRLDFHDEDLRILDYKTGRDTIKKVDTSSLLFEETDLKLNVQLLLYTLLVRKAYDKGAHPLKAGIFKLRSFEDGIDWLNEGERIKDDQLNDFQNALSLKIAELFNPNIPFVQTNDLKQCTYCDYKGLCSRQAT
ncbi:MAG: PD-(D/E)XK nuclease family protein [Bacteroidetes bacterium]|nr:PD-(D/E)XK nuclease family protein [Bacteroidota bacterium]